MTAVTTIAGGRGPYEQTHRILATSAATGMSVTGTVSETSLATVNIAAGAVGRNGIIRVTCHWGHNSSANNKTGRVRLGAAGAGISGTIFTAVTQTTNISWRTLCHIVNRNSESSQFGDDGNGTGGWAPSSAAWVTSSVDTSAGAQLVITGQLANTGDTMTLEAYLVELIRVD